MLKKNVVEMDHSEDAITLLNYKSEQAKHCYFQRIYYVSLSTPWYDINESYDDIFEYSYKLEIGGLLASVVQLGCVCVIVYPVDLFVWSPSYV